MRAFWVDELSVVFRLFCRIPRRVMHRLHVTCVLTLGVLSAVAGCDLQSDVVPDDDTFASEIEELPTKEDPKEKEPPPLPSEIPERLLEPSLQKLADQISAWGGSTQSELGKIIAINLANTRIDDRDLLELKKAADVQELTLSNTRITDRGLAILAEFKQLRQLHCEGTKITNHGMKSLAGLSELWNLRLSRTSFSTKYRRCWKDEIKFGCV